VSLFEQVALGGICLARALREACRPAQWPAWLPLLLARLALVAALAGCAHPLLSWAMAPLVRAAAGDGALHFPQLFAVLGPLAARCEPIVWALVGLPCAGHATRRFAAAFGRPAPRDRGSARETATLILAGLPAVLVALAVPAALDAMSGVRLSGISRLLLPQAGALVVLAAQAATFYVVAEVVLGEANALEALAAVPRSLAPGFLPALVVLAVVSLPLLVFAPFEALAAAGRWHALPEAAVPFACLHAVALTFVSMVATGAGALAWMGVLAEPENRP
jgi:hypothetical protein